MPAAAAAQLPDFTELVEKQGPAVVNISTTQSVRNPLAAADPQPAGRRSVLRVLPALHAATRAPDREFQSQSLGSGFIISQDGYILTNAHVVETADEITVKLTDKREFKAKVIGADRRTDIALIKIEAASLPAVRFGDPTRLKVGEWVLAIGSPVRFREHGHCRHRQRQGALAAAGELRAVHPDRRGGQSRQFGRAAVQPAGRSGRHQLPDLQPHRRLHGAVLCHPDRCRKRYRPAAAHHRQGDPRPHRRRDPARHQGAGRWLRPAQAPGRAGQFGGEGRSGREGGYRGRRRDSALRRQARCLLGGSAAHRRRDQARCQGDRAGLAQQAGPRCAGGGVGDAAG